MAPPPAATFLALHPQDNNIIAIGMDDSSIQSYNVRVNEVKTKLKVHQIRITGLAFSHVLNVLCIIWSRFHCTPLADTGVQFHQDQTHLLAVHFKDKKKEGYVTCSKLLLALKPFLEMGWSVARWWLFVRSSRTSATLGGAIGWCRWVVPLGGAVGWFRSVVWN
ncbi:hypothetical protein ACSQ67_001181 [Phaseolus vulgaris]